MKRNKWLLLTIGVFATIIIGLYSYQAIFFNTHFFPKTTINGEVVGKLNQKEAEAVLLKASEGEMLQFTDNGKVWQELPKKEIGIDYNYDESVKKALGEQKNWLWLVSYFQTHKETLDGSALNQDSLANYTASLSKELEKLNESRTPSKNATIKKEEKGFEIIPEVQGDNLDVEAVTKQLAETLAQGENNIELSKFIVKPTVFADDETLKKNISDIHKITEQKVDYYISGQTVTIAPAEIANWVDYNQKENKVALDKEKVRAYVTELGARYNTSTNATTFKSTARGEVSVPAGSLSWTIQTEQETEDLYNALLAGEGLQRSPSAVGSASVGSPLIGNTYVEIDLQNQHMYYYKDGSLALETDIVSGKPSTPTPLGVNYVWKKELKATLRGTNDDGSKYAEPVDYWMPIDWTGVGIHDSSWQSAYGGSFWKTAGSHGCLNTPPSVMAQFYKIVDVGTPVLVF